MKNTRGYLADLGQFVSGQIIWKDLLVRVEDHLAQIRGLSDEREDESALSSLELVLHEVAESYREPFEAYVLALRILEQAGHTPISDSRSSRYDSFSRVDTLILKEFDLDPDKNKPPIDGSLAPV